MLVQFLNRAENPVTCLTVDY